MTRVSLKEAYDNKDVVAQIYAIRDIAEGASDTADSAKTTADDAKTYVDTLGAQVEGAVQTANNASASAQTSAQTVAGYDARLTEAEGGLSQAESDIDGLETGLGAVTARVTTAEGDINALETADAQNVKINNVNQYAVGLTGNQTVVGLKRFENMFYIHARVQGTQALELARYPISTEMSFCMSIFTRYGSVECVLTITTNGVDTINDMTISKSVVSSTSILASALYAYIDTGKVVICFGNDISANNYFAILCRGNFNGAGVEANPDTTATYTGRNVTNASKVVIMS